MWDQIDAPLKVLHNASLGDPLFVLSEPVPLPSVPYVQYVQDPRIDGMLVDLVRLQQRVESLEQQTLSAYWTRFLVWLRRIWPWR